MAKEIDIEEYNRLRFQLNVLIQELGFNDYPIATLVTKLDWGEEELGRANDVFEEFDRKLAEYEFFAWQEMRDYFTEKLRISLRELIFLVEAFYRNNQWQRVCYLFATLSKFPELNFILHNPFLAITEYSLADLVSEELGSNVPLAREKQMRVVLDHFEKLDLPYKGIEDLRKALHRTKEARAELAAKYPPKSGLDQVVRAMFIENPSYRQHAIASARTRKDWEDIISRFEDRAGQAVAKPELGPTEMTMGEKRELWMQVVEAVEQEDIKLLLKDVKFCDWQNGVVSLWMPDTVQDDFHRQMSHILDACNRVGMIAGHFSLWEKPWPFQIQHDILVFYRENGRGPTDKDLPYDLADIRREEHDLFEMSYLEGKISGPHAGNPKGIVIGRISDLGIAYLNDQGL